MRGVIEDYLDEMRAWRFWRKVAQFDFLLGGFECVMQAAVSVTDLPR